MPLSLGAPPLSHDDDVDTPRSAFSLGKVSHDSEFLSTADTEGLFYIVNEASGDMIEVEYDYMTSLGTALHRAKKKWLDVDNKLSKFSLVKGKYKSEDSEEKNHFLSTSPTGLANKIYDLFDGWPGQKLLTFVVHLEA